MLQCWKFQKTLQWQRLDHSYHNAASSSNSKYSLIVSSIQLSLITSMNLSRRFFRLATKCQSVICARVTPRQKSEMVSLIKRNEQKS